MMKVSILFIAILLLRPPASGQLTLNSPDYKALTLLVNNIYDLKNDPVFQKYTTHQKKNIYYNVKGVAINYLTMRQKFWIDTNKRYNTELKDVPEKSEFNLYCITDSARLHIARGDLIISLFQPSYFHGYYYVMAYARNDASTYGDHISHFLFILNRRLKVVKCLYLKGLI